MSVCFFVPAEQAGTSGAEEQEQDAGDDLNVDSAQQALLKFWQNVSQDIKTVTAEDFKTQALPLARIKKIMKLDEEVKMISAEAPVLFAKAAEIFIHELTLRAWSHTEDNKRRTLQRNDIAMAISKSDQFDFLIDIVPRHEVKLHKPRDEQPHATSPVPPTDPLSPTSQATLQAPAGQQFVVQPCAQVVQQATTAQAATSNTVVQQPVTMVQQVVSSNGEIQQMPQEEEEDEEEIEEDMTVEVAFEELKQTRRVIQLTQAQLNMIRLQVQNNPSQPIIIQAQQPHQTTPQIIQVSSQAQHPGQQVFLAQVATSQDDS